MTTMLENVAHHVTALAISRHFLRWDDGKETGTNDGWCKQCAIEKYPLTKRYKKSPVCLDRQIYDSILALLENAMARLQHHSEVPTDLEKVEADLRGLEHEAEKMVHQRMEQQWQERKKYRYPYRGGMMQRVNTPTVRGSQRGLSYLKELDMELQRVKDAAGLPKGCSLTCRCAACLFK